MEKQKYKYPMQIPIIDEFIGHILGLEVVTMDDGMRCYSIENDSKYAGYFVELSFFCSDTEAVYPSMYFEDVFELKELSFFHIRIFKGEKLIESYEAKGFC